MRISIRQRAGVGDEVAVTPVIRELRRRMPRERIVLEDFRFPELFEGNPNLPGGDLDAGGTKMIEHNGPFMNAGSLPRKFAHQFGMTLVDDTPEIFLTDQEKANGWNVRGWERTVSIDTWSRDSSRRWPLSRFQRLVDRLNGMGWSVFEVGNHEGPRLERIRSSLRNSVGLRQTAAFIRRTSLYVGNDSGLFHVAAAVGTPQVVLFGLVPGRFRAYWTTTALGTYERCAGCGQVCTRPSDEGPSCLSSIPVDRVLEAIKLAADRFQRA